MMVFERKLYSIALSVVSSPTMNRIWDYIFTYSPSDIYNRIEQKGEVKTQGFISARYHGSPVEVAKVIYELAIQKSIKIIDFWDIDYPPLLKEINKPPLVLYCRGNFIAENSIAIVGTRNSDKKSSQITRRISIELAQAGFSIVSGMAIGIDREAHLGALQCNGSTIGVLANGIDIVYPSFNRDLYAAIMSSEKSALISEYPPEIFAGKWTFVRRNRIISGLSLGTIVVKAGEKSGALITSRYAIEQNREVFACPGLAFDEEYSGCHKLISNGATLISSVEDILRELPFSKNIKFKNNNNKLMGGHDLLNGHGKLEEEYNESSFERRILNLLSNGEMDLDTIVRLLNCNTSEVNEAIIMLELSGVVSRNGNNISKI